MMVRFVIRLALFVVIAPFGAIMAVSGQDINADSVSVEVSVAGQDASSQRVPGQQINPDSVAGSRIQASVFRMKPILSPSNAVVDELGWVNGSFSYKFGTSGWPDGFSPYGLNPNKLALQVGSISLNDLFTGRPRYDLIPVAWLSELVVKTNLSISASFDSLASLEPLTLIRYESSGNGSQAVRSLHVQNRLWGTGSEQRTLQTAFGYAGEGATGEYDGSQLRRAREVAVRLGYSTPTWQLELFEMAQRRTVGAHGGVLPLNGGSYISIYQRLGATVDDEAARRRTLRNDLTLKGSTQLSGIRASVTGVWTVQTLDFEGKSASEKIVLSNKGIHVDLSKPWGSQTASLVLKTDKADYIKSSILFDSDPNFQIKSSALGSLSGRLWAYDYAVEAGPETADGSIWARMDGTIRATHGPFEARITLHQSGRERQWHERIGFGEMISPLETTSHPVDQSAAATLSFRSRLVSVSWTSQFNNSQDQLLMKQGAGASVATVETLPGAATSLVSSLVIGFRDQQPKGIWAQVNPVLRSSSTNATSVLATGWRRSLPDLWASATIGWKATLFHGDFVLNTYARARYWGPMGGLRLHTPTGLLVLPADNSETLEANWLIDFVAEAGIRGATVFLSFENAFSGTTALIGNLMVPDYPLPQQRTRFGVYWPIFD